MRRYLTNEIEVRVLFYVSLFLLSSSALAQPLYAKGDYLTPDLRDRVEALKEEVQTVPTTLNNLADRIDVIWPWANKLALRGVHIPVELPRVVTQARQAVDGLRNTLPVVLPFVTEVVRELEVKEEQPGAIGTVTSTATGPYVVDSFVTFEQTYTIGEMPMQPGGGVMVAWELVARLDPFNRENPSQQNYITIRCSNPGAQWEQSTRPWLGMHGNIFAAAGMPVYVLRNTALQPGETITITYGDRSGGSLGLRLQITEVDSVLFPLYIDLEGKGNFFSPRWPKFRVVGGEAARARVVAPSIVKTGELFELAIRIEDQFYNRATLDIPEFDVIVGGNNTGTTPAGAGLSTISDVRFDAPGIHRVQIRARDGATTAESNPIWVQDDPKWRLYWGDTHAHTNMAEGQGAIDNFYRYAREDARLNFVVLSEHDTWMDDDEWRLMRDAAPDHTVPGKFLAFLGYEWTATVQYGGHHNVLFRTPYDRQRAAIQDTMGVVELIKKLHAQNDVRDVLVIPHAHIPGDWRIADPQTERLVEILSMHGTFEWFGNYYLRNGHMIGFVGASDDHSGRPGYSGPFTSGPLGQMSGLAAVMAPDLSIDGIFDAMRAIDAYATSGQRAILDVNLNGSPMGKRLPFAESRVIAGQVMGTAPIDTIEVIKNGVVMAREEFLRGEFGPDCWLRLAFGSPSEDLIRDVPRGHRVWKGSLELRDAKLLELRPQQIDNAYYETANIDSQSTTRVNFNLVTRGKEDVLLLHVAGLNDNSSISIRLESTNETGITFPRVYQPSRFPAEDVMLPLANLSRGAVTHDLPAGPYTDRIGVSVVQPEGPLDREFQFKDTGEVRDGDYYYVRVRQLDGDLAWSSPWWVGGIPPR